MVWHISSYMTLDDYVINSNNFMTNLNPTKIVIFFFWDFESTPIDGGLPHKP